MRVESLRGDPVAVIGMSGRFPGADDVAQYWQNLLDGVVSVSGPDADSLADAAVDGQYVKAIGMVDHVDEFAADHFRLTPAEAMVMDPQHRVLLEVAAAALDDAGYAGDRDVVVGVFVGCGENIYYRDFVAPDADGGRLGDVRVTLGNEKDFLAPRIAFKLGFTGPAITVQTGCATSLSAVGLACSSLAAGDCDIALAGGVSLLPPDVDGYTYREGGILSADGCCRPFDAAASGPVPGSGAGIVVLRRDEDARAAGDTRRAVIHGWAVNNDGGSRVGFAAPNVDGQETVIRTALARADLSPGHVGYIETHGTGTAIGDAVEFEALRRVFGADGRPARSVTLGAAKANIGHADAASGVAGLLKAVLAVERGVLPGTARFDSPNPDLDMAATPFTMSARTSAWPGTEPRFAGVSSFGLGGSNAHVVLGQATGSPQAPSLRPRSVLALSARTNDELQQMRERLADRLEMTSTDPVPLADVAFTLAVGRGRYVKRWSAAVSSQSEAITKLRTSEESARPTPRLSLSISGTPAELAELGKRLLHSEPLMRPGLIAVTGLSELHGLPAQRAGALTAAVVGRTLQRLGLTFARVDASVWTQPVAEWLASGAEAAALPEALDACTGEDTNQVARRDPGQVVIDASFDLAEVLSTAWQAGAAIDWGTYYAEELRQRVSLPAYPFTRQRFWLDRPARSSGPADSSSGRAARGVDGNIVSYVEQVWREVLGIEVIPPDVKFSDLGGDSIYAVEVSARLSEGLGLKLPVDLPFVAPTVLGSAAFIEKTLSRESRLDDHLQR